MVSHLAVGVLQLKDILVQSIELSGPNLLMLHMCVCSIHYVQLHIPTLFYTY